MKRLGSALAGALVLGQGVCAAPAEVEAAARRFSPEISWQSRSVVSGDFSCKGRSEQAILGVAKGRVVVAIFTRELSGRPETVALEESVLDGGAVALAVESLDVDVVALERDLGWRPPGLRRSKSCVGLTLNDQQVDPVHVYWNRAAARLQTWSQ